MDGYERTIRKSKSLYSSSSEGTQTQIQCVYNQSTDHIYIKAWFHGQGGWVGGASTNHTCPVYLGVVISERVLAEVFENVEHTIRKQRI